MASKFPRSILSLGGMDISYFVFMTVTFYQVRLCITPENWCNEKQFIL